MVQDEDMDMSRGRMSKGEWTEVPLQKGEAVRGHQQLHQLEQSNHIHPNLGMLDSGSKGHCWNLSHGRSVSGIYTRGYRRYYLLIVTLLA
jgi:hypothetical protein